MASGADAVRAGLSGHERQQIRDALRPRATIVHEVIRAEGEEELKRTISALAWSGLAAGLSMGFSLVGEGLLHQYLPDAVWRPLLESFGYTIGFVIVVLGRQQLFTENTLTGVIPVLAHRNLEYLLALLRLWSVVLVANLAGTALFALLAANAPIFDPNLHSEFTAIGEEAVKGGFLSLFAEGVIAGWLIGLMVWMLPGAGSARLFVILLITWLVAVGGFAHVIAGSVEALYLVAAGRLGMVDYLVGYLAPVLAGNIVGGSALVAMLNHAQVKEELDEALHEGEHQARVHQAQPGE